jgi:cardiolipin synthase A/B
MTAPPLHVLYAMRRIGNVRKRTKVLIAIGAVVSMILVFAQDPSTVRLDSAIPIEDQRFHEYVGAVTASPSSRGDRYEMLLNGDQIYPAMLEAIRSAQRRVNFLTYIYSPGEAANQFTSALADAGRRGVEVNVVVDAFGASDIPEDHIEQLQNAGVSVGHYRPVRWYSIQESNYRNHRKILVVDGEVAFTGGVGVADHWLGSAEDMDHWRDSQFRIRGPAVRYVEAVFYESLAQTLPRVKPKIGPAGDGLPPEPAGDAASVVVSSAPNGGSGGVKRLFLMTIGAAKRTLDITTPYFVVDDSTSWALEQARRRGVRIRILVEGELTDAKTVKWASRSDYDALLRQGIEIYEYQPTMMHAKTTVVDGRWSIIGSANFDNRSLDMNDEINVGIADPILAERLVVTFEDDLTRAKPLTLDLWRARPLHEKTNEKFWSLLREFF